MPGEVLAGGGDEGVPADVRRQLLEHGGALGVGDPVKVLTGGLQIGDVGDDRMRGGVLVLHIGPGFAARGEGGPRAGVLGGLGHGQGAHVVGEGLLEPEVVPPRHGHQIPEPHVRHLVHDRVRPALELGLGGLGLEEVLLGEGDQSGVLHGAEVVLGHEGLVVLAPEIGHTEELVEEVQARLRDREQGVRVQGRGHGLTAVEAQAHLGCTGLRVTAPGVLHPVVGAREQGGDVGGQRRGVGEVHSDGAAVGPLALLYHSATGLRLVGGQHPVGRSGEMDSELGLEVRLLEVGEDPAGICRLVLGVEVDLTVGRVLEAVHPLAGGGVERGAHHGHRVLCLQIRKEDAGGAHHLVHVQHHPVELHRLHAVVQVVQERA